jgi:hypothetical protein
MATTEIVIQKTETLGKATIVEVRINLGTSIAEFHYDLTDKAGLVSKQLFTADLSQWPKFAGMITDLCEKAGQDIEKAAKKTLKDKQGE